MEIKKDRHIRRLEEGVAKKRAYLTKFADIFDPKLTDKHAPDFQSINKRDLQAQRNWLMESIVHYADLLWEMDETDEQLVSDIKWTEDTFKQLIDEEEEHHQPEHHQHYESHELIRAPSPVGRQNSKEGSSSRTSTPRQQHNDNRQHQPAEGFSVAKSNFEKSIALLQEKGAPAIPRGNSNSKAASVKPPLGNNNSLIVPHSDDDE